MAADICAGIVTADGSIGGVVLERDHRQGSLGKRQLEALLLKILQERNCDRFTDFQSGFTKLLWRISHAQELALSAADVNERAQAQLLGQRLDLGDLLRFGRVFARLPCERWT